jgi:hypothetical protein
VILLNRLRRRAADDPKVQWQEDEYVPQVDLVDGALPLGTETAIVVDNAAFFTPGDAVVVLASEETMLVTVVTIGTNTLTVERSWGATAAAAIADNAELLIIGPATKEGDDAPDSRTTVTANKFNFIQIFRKSYKLTRTLADNMKLLTDPDTEFQRNKKLEEQMLSIERSLFFGEKREDTATTATTEDPRRSMGGIREFVTSNITTVGGALTKATFDGFLKTAFRRGSRNKWLFASDTVNAAISGFANAQLQTRMGEETFNLAITKYVSPHGMVNIVEEKLFAETTLTGQQAFLLDMEELWLRVMADTTRRENIQAPGETKRKEEYISEFSLEVRNEKAHSILKTVTG